jgi:hypothetical protein
MIRRDAKRQFIEDLESLDPMINDLIDVAEQYHELIRETAHPEKEILKKGAEEGERTNQVE